MENLPEDIMLYICVKLPVKSVGRFRCVNWTWYYLLNDEDFVKNHLNHATEMNRLSLMLHHSWVEDPRTFRDKIYTIDYDPSLSTCSVCVYKELPFVGHGSSMLGFLGHCNGLVCLSPHMSQYDFDTLTLWNPSTNQRKRLPEAPFRTESFSHNYCIVGGFGYDYKTGSFKVVILVRHWGRRPWSEEGTEVYLYTLGSYYWRQLRNIPYSLDPMPHVAQVAVNGVIHWEASRKYDELYRRVILSFDFEKEIFQEMPWPDLFGEEFRTSMCVLGGSLCICGVDPDSAAEVWELKVDCEVRKSWRKLFTIDIKKHLEWVVDFVPLQSLKNGEFLVGFDTPNDFQVHQYEPKSETSRPLVVYGCHKEYSSKTRVYVESLVSLNSDESDDGDNVEDDIW